MLEPPASVGLTARSQSAKVDTEALDAPPHSQVRQANPVSVRSTRGRQSHMADQSHRPHDSGGALLWLSHLLPALLSGPMAARSSSNTNLRQSAIDRRHCLRIRSLRPRRIRHPATHWLVDPLRPRRPLQPHHHPLPRRRRRFSRESPPSPASTTSASTSSPSTTAAMAKAPRSAPASKA